MTIDDVMKMIHDNEYMRKDDARDKIRAAIEALAAPAAPRAGREMMPTIETRAGVPVLVMSTGARPATDAEVAFFAEAERLRAYIANLAAAPAAPQQVEPVAQIGWADEFGNLFPMGAWKPAQRTHHDSHKTAWRPVFLHPPAAEVQRLREALEYLIEKCGDSDDAQYSTLGTKFVRDIARRALEGGE